MSTEWKRRAGTVMGLTHRIYCAYIRYFVAFLLHDFPFKLIDAGGNRVILVAALHSYGVSIARQPDRVFSPIWHYWVNLASLSLITPKSRASRAAEPSHVEWNTERASAGNNRKHMRPQSLLQQTRKRRREQSAQRDKIFMVWRPLQQAFRIHM